METGTDILTTVLSVGLVLIIVIIFIAKLIVQVYMPFSGEREFLRMEIMRSQGNERAHWKRELRRLYLNMIPFVGKWLAARNRGKKR